MLRGEAEPGSRLENHGRCGCLSSVTDAVKYMSLQLREERGWTCEFDGHQQDWARLLSEWGLIKE